MKNNLSQCWRVQISPSRVNSAFSKYREGRGVCGKGDKGDHIVLESKPKCFSTDHMPDFIKMIIEF